jgi:Na+/H+-dicarboxylate symporter
MISTLLSIALAFILEPFMDISHVSFFYTLSVAFKDLLVWFLPFIIFTYIAESLMKVEAKHRFSVFIIFGAVFISNFIAAMFGYGVGELFIPHLSLSQTSITIPDMGIQTYFTIPIKPLINSTQAMVAGIITGFMLNFFPNPVAHSVIHRLKIILSTILHKTVVPILPFYIFGFLLKMSREGMVSLLLTASFQVTILGIMAVLVYELILYKIGQRQLPYTQAIKNMMPACITGFSTMSSAVAMPLMMSGTEKNLPHNKSFGDLIIPLTASIHPLGDSIMIPMLIVAVQSMFGMPLGFTLDTFVTYALSYCVVKFSSAAVPGGGILVLIPVFASVLNMNSDMISVITTLYIVLDPIFTFSNVLGNGAFALIMEKILYRTQTKPSIA